MGSGRPGHGWHAIGERRGWCLRTGTERTVRVRSPDADCTRRWTRTFRAAVGSAHCNGDPVTQAHRHSGPNSSAHRNSQPVGNSHPVTQADCNGHPDPHKGNGTQRNSDAHADRHSPNADKRSNTVPRQDPQRRRQR